MKPELLNLESCQNCESSPCLPCVEDKLRVSEYGQMLETNPPRFDYWAWDSPFLFKNFLGQDVDPFFHGIYQARNIAIPLMEANNASEHHKSFSKREQKLLYLANVLHDSHEGVTGDIAVPDKTRQSDIDELEVNFKVNSEIVGENLALELRDIIGDFEQRTFLGRAFKAGEVCGYFLTGMRAWHLRNHPLLTDDERAKCFDMGQTVIQSNVPKLGRYAEEFPYVADLLRASRPAIEESIK